MGAPKVELLKYAFPFDHGEFALKLSFMDDDGDATSRVRSVELESIRGVNEPFYLSIGDNDDVYLNYPTVPSLQGKAYKKIPLRFVVGYTDYSDEEYEDLDVRYELQTVELYAVSFGDHDPSIQYVENLASRVNTSVGVVVHGAYMTDGLGISLYNGETEYVVSPEEIKFDIDIDGTGTASFDLTPDMFTDGAEEPCSLYGIYFSYGKQRYGDDSISLIRYKYDEETEALQRFSTESVTREKKCYDTGTMELVFDRVDGNGNLVPNPGADPSLGNDIVIRNPGLSYYENNHYVYHGAVDDLYGYLTLKNSVEGDRIQVMENGELRMFGDVSLDLEQGIAIELTAQEDESENGLWFVTGGEWVRNPCDAYVYTMVRLKYNKNLTHKAGQLKLSGVQLYEGDVVWLSAQAEESENGLWVVQSSNWTGFSAYGPSTSIGCPDNCAAVEKPFPVNKFVIVDLGARASYRVDYVCGDEVPYKCGVRTICNYKVSSGNVVALLNQASGGNGVYLVTCGNWVKIADIQDSDVNGTVVDLTNQIVVQNDIDFCECGGVFHIDYFLLNPSCYLWHLQRTVKIMCGNASIAPNSSKNQFSISEYLISVGEEDALVGNRGKTPGDPVRESCTVDNEDFEYDFGMKLVERRQYVKEPACIPSPLCDSICDIPRIFNVSMTNGYSSSSDRNGFTIKFWRSETDGWHLYAYIGSGTPTIGMDYYVYHLHVRGKATENMVDVNEHDWFSTTSGVIADGDGLVFDNEGHIIGSDSFGLCDDKWEFRVIDINGVPHIEHTLNSETLYMPWRISCTTNLFAHCINIDHEPRVTCADMGMGAKTVAAVGDMCDSCAGTGEDGNGNPCEICNGSGRSPSGYLVGMLHLFGVGYYTTAMSKAQFVEEYNQYVTGTDCIWKDVVDVLATDDDTEYVDPNITGSQPISTDDGRAIRS